jgi:predicted nuclease of predicted toxin-antitoxin system
LKFVDAQLPPSLARWISSRAHQAIHGVDIAMHTAADAAICVLVTKDEDFVDRWLLSPAPIALVWIRKGNCSNDALLTWLEPLWSETVKRLDQGERLIELRG